MSIICNVFAVVKLSLLASIIENNLKMSTLSLKELFQGYLNVIENIFKR